MSRPASPRLVWRRSQTPAGRVGSIELLGGQRFRQCASYRRTSRYAARANSSPGLGVLDIVRSVRPMATGVLGPIRIDRLNRLRSFALKATWEPLRTRASRFL